MTFVEEKAKDLQSHYERSGDGLARATKRVAVTLLLAIGVERRALADDIARTAMLDQLQAQFSACVAYYAVEFSCLGSGDARRRLDVVSRRSDALASAISMSAADAALRLELNVTAERNLMQNECGNISSLESRYGVDCDPLSSNRE